jgi:hypothetical protein
MNCNDNEYYTYMIHLISESHQLKKYKTKKPNQFLFSLNYYRVSTSRKKRFMKNKKQKNTCLQTQSTAVFFKGERYFTQCDSVKLTNAFDWSQI